MPGQASVRRLEMKTARASTWMKAVLWIAGAYNLLWGALAVLFPIALFQWAGMTIPTYPELWQCIGMIVGVYGVGYAIAAGDPYRHWPIVLVGLLGKVLGPLGFAQAYWRGRLPLQFGVALLTNDLVWWLPFSLILCGTYRSYAQQRRSAVPDILRLGLRARTEAGESLESLSQRSPVLILFLRHAGCPFCREALADLAKQRANIENTGVAIAFVHMGTEAQAHELLRRYGLEDLPRISDPHRGVYRAFGLTRGTLTELFGPRVWWRGLEAMLWERHGAGWLIGDSFQMPGVFLLYHGEVIRSFRHHSIADRPDYAAMAQGETFP